MSETQAKTFRQLLDFLKRDDLRHIEVTAYAENVDFRCPAPWLLELMSEAEVHVPYDTGPP